MAYQKYFWVIILITICLTGYTQPYSTNSKKALRHFKEAAGFFDNRKDQQALDELDAALKADENFVEAWLMKAEIFSDRKDYLSEMEAYQRALEIPGISLPMVYFRLAKAEFKQALYAEAKENLEQFLTYRVKKSIADEARKMLISAELAIKLVASPVPFEPENLGPAVNSEFDDYMPSVTVDESLLVITREIPSARGQSSFPGNKTQEDFFACQFVNGAWSSAKELGPPINSPENEGAQSLSADGRHMFFTGCDRPVGYGSCDIYLSRKSGSSWGEPVNLGSPVNTGAWESQPSFSADGRTLFFASNRPGGKGGMDIWRSTYDLERGYWSVPENLGDSINTSGDEMSPFIHPDNQTLYFASDGHPGLGGADMFLSRRVGKNNWKTPVNLGYPVNTNLEESYLVVNARGEKAYFASNRPGSRGMDIYSFSLYPKARPILVTYVKGKVFDAENRRFLPATIEMVDLESREIVGETSADPKTGEFLISLPAGKDYAMNIRSDQYLFNSQHFSLSNTGNSEPFRINVPLEPIKQGNKTILRNIFFESNSYSLKSESEVELMKLVSFLVDNPEIRIEIGGHTDNVGTPDFNLNLSRERAKAVYQFLKEHDINPARLDYRGYGEEQPVSDNDSEEGRAQNRRTEFKIL